MKTPLRNLVLRSALGITMYATNALVAQTYQFTTAGASGSVGPTQSQLNMAYLNTNLNNAVISNFGIQSWTVPVTGPYKIIVTGAQGAGNGGYGAEMQGDFNLVAGQVLNIVVGQRGENGTGASQQNNSGGGGGGSFIVLGADSLLIAAGGGGAGLLNTPGGNASTLTSGGSTIWNGGGIDGNGGYSGITNGDAAGGGGFYTDGENSYNTAQNVCEGGKAFLFGAYGGASGNCGSYYGGAGGFGGGGSGWHNGINRGGAGGGYSGGQGGTLSAILSGGGGGSFNSGNNQINQEGLGLGDGSVKIIFPKGPDLYTPDGTLGAGSISTSTSVATKIVNEALNNSVINIYPNPSTGMFTTSILTNPKTHNYKIFTVEGKMILEVNSNEQQVAFNISEFNKGIYYLSVDNDKAKKIIKK